MKRSFCLGSEWLYYKIYSGVKTADTILEKLHPIINELLKKGIISKWFFIRYRDPEDHIRLRFLSDSPEKVSQIIQPLYPVLNEFLESDLIWKLQTDTYHRELERYGESTIELSESLFFYDSEMIVNYLSLKSYIENNTTELLFSFLAINRFLDSFSLTNSDKLALLNELQLSFKTEFKADKNLKKEFDKHYRELAPEMEKFLNLSIDDNYYELIALVIEKGNKIAAISATIKENIEISLFGFIQSHIHMMINRQYTSKQRNYECLLYDHLFRYYKMVCYKETFKD
jgi:thiopeptide-type bacteriocin biosynthesis protein